MERYQESSGKRFFNHFTLISLCYSLLFIWMFWNNHIQLMVHDIPSHEEQQVSSNDKGYNKSVWDVFGGR